MATLRMVMMPKDTNPSGTIFGGVILANVDVAGVVEARRHVVHRYATVAMDKVTFKAPVYVGDIVSFFAETVRVGRTSITVQVDVVAERGEGGECVEVTQATVTYVAMGRDGKPMPIGSQAG